MQDGICGAFSTASYANKLTIINSYNTGKISSNDNAGGIIGASTYTAGGTIINCYNKGKIHATTNAGGIIGGKYLGQYWIYNCYNSGEISATNVGGIIGRGGIKEISNSFNIGSILSLGDFEPAGIVGFDYNDATTENSYYLDNVKVARALGGWGSTSRSEVGNSCTEDYLKSNEFLELINKNATNNEGWVNWKKGNEGYPVLDLP